MERRACFIFQILFDFFAKQWLRGTGPPQLRAHGSWLMSNRVNCCLKSGKRGLSANEKALSGRYGTGYRFYYGAVGEVTLMFTITFRVTKKQLAAAAAALVLAFAGGLWAKSALSELAGDVAQAPAEVKIEKTAAKTNEQRISFLESFGWEVESEAEEILDVLIPKEMDDVFSNYNEIQKAQGCDLTKYAGKRCKRYTYIVNNYPDQPENIRANIVTYKNKIIGGDICSIELDGFMHGFAAETD